MSKAYVQVSGVPGNSDRPGWIELFKLEVNTDWKGKPSVAVGMSWIRPIRVYAWSVQGPHTDDLQAAWTSGKKFASAVLEVVKIINKNPVVKQRVRMKNVSVINFQLNSDPGYVKPIAQFALGPDSYVYEVGSALQFTREPKEPLTVS